MRSKLPQCARLLTLAVITAGCSRKANEAPPNPVPVTVTAICSPDSIKLAVDSSTVHIHHAPTSVQWSLGQASNADVTITPDGPDWPFDESSPPPFPVGNQKPYTGRGKAAQAHGNHQYTIRMICNGKPVIFDPDIWVD